MTIMDTSYQFYRSLWVRLIITGFCMLWSIVEFSYGQPFWGTIVGSSAIWSAYALLLLTYKPPPDEAKPAPEEPQGKT